MSIELWSVSCTVRRWLENRARNSSALSFMMARSNPRTTLFHGKADHHAYLVLVLIYKSIVMPDPLSLTDPYPLT